MNELLTLQTLEISKECAPERASWISLFCDGENSGASLWCGPT